MRCMFRFNNISNVNEEYKNMQQAFEVSPSSKIQSFWTSWHPMENKSELIPWELYQKKICMVKIEMVWKLEIFIK